MARPVERNPPIRFAVIGVGYMGAIHAAKIRQLERLGEGVELAGVADTDRRRAAVVASELDVVGATDYRELLSRCDAAIVAVPTQQHFVVAKEVMRAGCDVLVEKPLADTLARARSLCGLAARNKRVLQVGHLECFNPAFQTLQRIFDAPSAIVVRRTSRAIVCRPETDVVRELMIHDLHIVSLLFGDEPTHIVADGRCVLNGTPDIASARLTYSGQCVVRMTANRMTVRPTRRYCIRQGDDTIVADFVRQIVVQFQGQQRERRLPRDVTWRPANPNPEPVDVALEQMRAFARAVRERNAGAVAGLATLGALQTALRILGIIDAGIVDRHDRAGIEQVA